MKNTILSVEELEAVGRALAGGLLDEVMGEAMRKEWLLEEIESEMLDETDDSLRANLQGAIQKIGKQSDAQANRMIALANAAYRLFLQEALFEMSDDDCLCADCCRRAELN